MPSLQPVVVPLRFVFAGRALQTTSRHLGTGGVYVRLAQPPPPGSEVRLDLYLPDSTYPEMANAIVRTSSREPGDEGCWCEFVGLRNAVLKRIATLVTRALGDAADSDARAHPRHPTRIRVRFDTAREFVIRYAYDLSAGGLFVSGDPLPPDTEVKLSLELPDGGPPVEVDSMVVRSVESSAGEGGVGLQFIGANEEFRARVDAFIERLAAEPCWDEKAANDEPAEVAV